MSLTAHCPLPSNVRSQDGPRPWILLLLLAAACCGWAPDASAQEAEWIWTSEHDKDSVPEGATCFFRKTFVVRNAEQAQIEIMADDSFEVFLNGRRLGQGESTRRMQTFDASRYVSRGRNTVAIRVQNERGETAALVARVSIKERDGGWENYSTDDTWVWNMRPLPLWNTVIYNDSRWPQAQSFGQLGDTVPWDREEGIAVEESHRGERFTISEEFTVERLIDEEKTGSIIAMTFNEFGQLILSREGGPLMLCYDADRDGVFETIKPYCEQVTSSQGILALNGEVYVTGEGPDGPGLYRLSDADRDGTLENVKTLVKFKGPMGEHGAHGVTLGPDGLIYVVVGNHTSPVQEYEASSPHRDFYEGDLAKPRYEDPGGHAVGKRVPGGVVLRTDIEGRSVQIVAGGLRNAYDLAFNRDGELFVHDSDMESDMGTSWYQPTRLFHVTPGSEFGWRSGWAKWPDYYVDRLPSILDTDRGSPTGAVFYNHFKFPQRYHNALFLADWSEGRILAVTLKRNGASYSANSEVFLRGSPLNVTDLSIGPDGHLYFATGGRGTRGGVYRVVWKGTVPPGVADLGQGMTAVIRQPQLSSATSRQTIATLKTQLGGNWDRMIVGVARSTANPAEYRLRALDLMHLFGPPPTADLLVELASDKSELVRAKAVELMGVHSSDTTTDKLLTMLGDSDRLVRRKVCEALMRAEATPEFEDLVPILASDDRFEAWAARRLLEAIPTDQWREEVLKSDDHRVLIQGGLALVIADPQKSNGLAVLERIDEVMEEFVSDRDFIDMLRLQQVAIHRGEINLHDVPALREKLAAEFPSGNSIMNRELVRLLAYLQVTSIMERYIEYLESDMPFVDRLHLALHMRYLESGWSTSQKLALLKFYETAQRAEGGGSYAQYVANVTRDFAKTFTDGERNVVLARGDEFPMAALGALYKLPKSLDDGTRALLEDLSNAIEDQDGKPYKSLRVGIVAVLARSGDEPSYAILRDLWERDPELRSTIALGLTTQPDGDNWSYLVRSLPLLEGPIAKEVVSKLLTVEKAPAEAEYIRQLILCGLRLQQHETPEILELLSYWTGEEPAEEDADWEEALQAWQTWFAATYPQSPEARLPVASADAKWQLEELVEQLQDSKTLKDVSIERGELVFTKAQCVKCHRVGTVGESVGPDLTSLSRRFTQREVVEALLFPSHVISDQYATRTVITTGGRQYTGMAAAGAEGEIVLLQANGEKVTLTRDEIEEVAASKISVMPEGLLNDLTLQEIADLFAFLKLVPQRLAAAPETTTTK